MTLVVTWHNLDVLHIFTIATQWVSTEIFPSIPLRPRWFREPVPIYLHMPTYIITKEYSPAAPGTTQGTIRHTKDGNWGEQVPGLGCRGERERSPCSSRAGGSQGTQMCASFPKWEGKDPAWDGFQG